MALLLHVKLLYNKLQKKQVFQANEKFLPLLCPQTVVPNDGRILSVQCLDQMNILCQLVPDVSTSTNG